MRKLLSSGRMRSVVPAAFVAVGALVMCAAIIDAPLGVRLMLHSTLLALGAALFARGWLLSRQERALLDREHLAGTALGASEEKFRTLVANVPGAVYRCAADPPWTMAFCSDGFQEITGFPASDFLGNSRRTFASVIHEEDRAGVEADVAAGLSAGHSRVQSRPRRRRHSLGLSSLALLPYETVRTAADPRGTLLAFLENAYQAGAHASGWDADDVESSWRPDVAG